MHHFSDAASLREAFTAAIPRVPVTFGYRLRLAAVLAALLLLQALYLALVAVVMVVTVGYVLLIVALSPPLNWLTLALYAGPPFAGVVTTIFLLKPLVIRPPRGPSPPVLDRTMRLCSQF